MAAAQAAIQVTLRCSDTLDEYETRKFPLHPGSTVTIGRASKNNSKPELMIGPDNAYIDSPTISRMHAVLTATPPPASQVYITDKKSMHGTMVNGNKLEPEQPHRLNSGDALLFGANVTREQEFYTARKFTIEYDVPNRSYSQGITVPDDSSDEEDVSVDDAMSCPPRYGSLRNPVTIEDADQPPVNDTKSVQPDPYDSDELDDDELDRKIQETAAKLLNGSPVRPSEDTHERSVSPVDSDHVFYPETLSDRLVFPDEASSSSDGASSDDEEEEASQIDSCAPAAGSDESRSDGDLDQEEEMSHYDDDHNVDADDDHVGVGEKLINYEAQLKLLEKQNKIRYELARQEQEKRYKQVRERFEIPEPLDTKDQGHNDTPAENVDAARGDAAGTLPSTSYAPYISVMRQTQEPPSSTASELPASAEKDNKPMSFTPNAPPAPPAEPSRLTGQETRPAPWLSSSNPFDYAFEPMLCNMEPVLAGHPTGPRPMQWNLGVGLGYGGPFPQQNTQFIERELPAGYVCQYPVAHTNPYGGALPPQPTSDNTFIPYKNPPAAAAPRAHTPPASVSEISSPPPPVRRTEISITEIVEDTTQQPPTPTSDNGGSKRKADALDEPVEEPETEPLVGPLPTSSTDAAVAGPVVDAPIAEAAAAAQAAIDQRPKKRLRTRLGGAVRTAAAWMVPGVVGAAASVAFLTSVPNDFFVA